jgi:hypothetical protein
MNPRGNNLITFTTKLQGELKRMQWQEHKCPNPSHSNPTKATKAMDRYERKNKLKEENHKELQGLNPNGFPSLRGDIDWWKCGSRSPLPFP